jgi:hypothetical protein
MTKNLLNDVWLNSTTSLSFVELTGTYTADVPLVLPHQFMLVMKGATINAHKDFPTNTADYTVNGCTVKGNSSPDTNLLSISVTNWALIVFKAAYYSGVVSPGGPGDAILDCSAMPYHTKDETIVGPAGVFMTGAGAILIGKTRHFHDGFLHPFLMWPYSTRWADDQ